MDLSIRRCKSGDRLRRSRSRRSLVGARANPRAKDEDAHTSIRSEYTAKLVALDAAVRIAIVDDLSVVRRNERSASNEVSVDAVLVASVERDEPARNSMGKSRTSFASKLSREESSYSARIVRVVEISSYKFGNSYMGFARIESYIEIESVEASEERACLGRIAVSGASVARSCRERSVTDRRILRSACNYYAAITKSRDSSDTRRSVVVRIRLRESEERSRESRASYTVCSASDTSSAIRTRAELAEAGSSCKSGAKWSYNEGSSSRRVHTGIAVVVCIAENRHVEGESASSERSSVASDSEIGGSSRSSSASKKEWMDGSARVDERIAAISDIAASSLSRDPHRNVMSPARRRVGRDGLANTAAERVHREDAIRSRADNASDSSHEPRCKMSSARTSESGRDAPLARRDPYSGASVVLANSGTAYTYDASISSVAVSYDGSSYTVHSSSARDDICDPEERRSEDGAGVLVELDPSRNSGCTDDTEGDASSLDHGSYAARDLSESSSSALEVA